MSDSVPLPSSVRSMVLSWSDTATPSEVKDIRAQTSAVQILFRADKKPYLFLCNGVAVKVPFAETIATIEDKLEEYICQRFLQKCKTAAEKFCRRLRSIQIGLKKYANLRFSATDPSLLADWFAAATAVESLGQSFAHSPQISLPCD